MFSLTHLCLSILLIDSAATFTINKRVRGGHEFHPLEHPYLVALYILSDTPEKSNTCSGSILNTQWVISAGHCFPDEVQKVNIYQNWKESTNDNRIKIGVAFRNNVIIHPEFEQDVYRYDNYENDLALIKSEEPMKLHIMLTWPVKLPYKNAPIGNNAFIVGYGENEFEIPFGFGKWIPREGVIEISECRSESAKGAHVICSYDEVRSGFGDSGGPLVSGDVLVGVISSEVVSTSGTATVYADVFYNRPWIEAVMSSVL